MRRYSVYDVYWSFWIVMVLSFGSGAIWRGCARDSRFDDIENVTSDVRLLRAAEGKLAQGESSQAKLFMNHVKKLQAMPEFKDKVYPDLLANAKKLKDIDAATIAQFDPERWKNLQPLVALAKMEAFEEAAKMDPRFPMQEILEGKKTVSETVIVPEQIPWWSFGFWVWFYLAASAVFVIALSIYEAAENRKHPITQFPWHRVDGLLMALAAAPATVPVLAGYGFYRLWTADWTTGLPKFKDRLRTLAYQTRLLRHLPRPTLVVAPMQLTGPALEAVPAMRVPERAAGDGAEPLWYVMPGEVFLGHTGRLKEAGVGVYPIMVHEPRAFTGWAVQASDIEKFEETLRLTDIEADDYDTDIDRTVLRTYDPSYGSVEIEYGERKNHPWLAEVLKRASAYAGGVDLYFTDKYFDRDVPPEANAPGIISIYHCATPAEAREQIEYHRAYGLDHAEALTGLAPAEAVGSVIRDQDGVPVAQVSGRVIYTLIHGMLTGKGEWRREAFAAMLHQAVAESVRQGDKGEDDESTATFWRRDIDQHRDKYAEICFDRFETRRKDIEKRIEACKKAVADAGAKITGSLRDQKESEKQLEIFLRTEWAEEQERLKKEFDALSTSKYVLSVQARDTGIDVYTRTVFIEHLGKRYRIGRFRLSLYDSGVISIANVANSRNRNNEYEHPHIRSGGYICWGNIQQSIAKLMADRQYAVAVNMIYRFLESYNPHGGVASINDWKEASREE